MSYSEVLDWPSTLGDLDKRFLIEILHEVGNEMKSESLVEEIVSFKRKIFMNLNLDMHFRNMLTNIKEKS